jgi:hypothetical protein
LIDVVDKAEELRDCYKIADPRWLGTYSAWLREAFPFGSAPRFVIFDGDAKYGLEVPAALRSLKVNPVRTSFESPWQYGVAGEISYITSLQLTNAT